MNYRDIFEAIKGNDIEAVKEFLPEHVNDSGYAPDEFLGVINPLRLACLDLYYRSDIALLLIRHGADVNCRHGDGWTPLHTVCGQSNIEVLKALIAAGADVNAKTDENRVTPLHCACAHGDIAAINLLVEAGADVDAQFMDGDTALHRVCQPWPNLKLVKELVRLGADVNIQNFDSQTPLHRACEADSGMKIPCFLIQHGADIEEKDYNGNTPLHLASRCDSIEVVKTLIEAGADANVKNEDGETPLELLSFDNRRVIELYISTLENSKSTEADEITYDDYDYFASI